MKKLPEVQAAKELMTEAMDWSVFSWMFHKGRVRETADQANAALDKLNRNVKSHWSDEIKAAYHSLSGKAASKQPVEKPQSPVAPVAPELLPAVDKIKAADVAAHRARADAEKTFDEADRQLNLDLAREGCKKAIHAWELHEKAIRAAEAVMHRAQPEAGAAASHG